MTAVDVWCTLHYNRLHISHRKRSPSGDETRPEVTDGTRCEYIHEWFINIIPVIICNMDSDMRQCNKII